MLKPEIAQDCESGIELVLILSFLSGGTIYCTPRVLNRYKSSQVYTCHL